MKTPLKNPLVSIEFAKARTGYFVEAQKYKRGLLGIKISRERRPSIERISVEQDTSEPLDMPSVTLPDFGPKESGWKVAEEKIPLERIFMDADRQKLELDITKEFEFADGEATRLIDESG